MAVFGPDNRGGRPLGAKTRLARKVFEDALKVWTEPAADGSDINRGIAALRMMYQERPTDFCKLIGSILPRDLILEGSMFSEHDDTALARLERTLALVQEQDDGEGEANGGASGRALNGRAS